jgi:HSP20 family molecular chaperone IbpA
MSAGARETGDMMVVTVRVPTTSAGDLAVRTTGRRVTVIGPGDFRHEVTMATADLDRLRAQLFRDILELRAPHAVEPRVPAVDRAVPVETLP